MAHQTTLPVIALVLLAAACGGEGALPLTAPSSVPQTPPPAPPAPNGSIAGQYTLNLTIGADCGVLPASSRQQSLTAEIEPTGSAGYVVTLGGANFLGGPICTASGLGCHQFIASQDNGSVRFDLRNEDDWHGGHIVMRLGDGTWMELIGSATGRHDGGTIAAQGSVSAWYCPTSRSYPFPCSNFESCDSNQFTLTFTTR